MVDSFATAFHQMSSILGICPHCNDLFRLSDARPYLKGKKVETIVDQLSVEERRVERAEEKLADQEAVLRAGARKKGQQAAKRKLKKIDPVFSGAGIDPQDVKVIFDPVEFIIFDGLSKDNVKRLLFMGHQPISNRQEKIQLSLAKTIKDGNFEFKTLRVTNDGQVSSS